MPAVLLSVCSLLFGTKGVVGQILNFRMCSAREKEASATV